jgi:serine/threonine-protein kinase
MVQAPVQAGDVLAGKYRVDRVLGMGGMGVVVAATHLQLGQHVALKFMLPHALENAEAVARFLREAQAVVRLKSENVARVFDVGTLETGSPYIVMEYLDGHDLGARVEAQGAMPVAEAVDYVLQACEAVAEAHSLGIVHRDLKPANLFLTQGPDGSPLVKVLDFGISKAQLGSAGSALTKTTALMGSPAYMSPEQMKASRDVDARADIWALGVILYQLVSARLPFDAPTMPELCVRVLTDPFEPLTEIVPEIHPEFAAVVSHCLQKDRDSRFANVAEFAAALAPHGGPDAHQAAMRIANVLRVSVSPEVLARASSAAGAAPPRTLQRTATPVVKAATTLGGAAAELDELDLPARKSPLPLVLGACALVILGAGVAFVATRSGSSPQAVPAAQPAAPQPAAVAPVPEPSPRALATPDAGAIAAPQIIAPPQKKPSERSSRSSRRSESPAPAVPERPPEKAPPKPAPPASDDDVFDTRN